MNTQIRDVVSGAILAAADWRKFTIEKEKMNDMENRKIKQFIVWVRRAFIILIGGV